MATSTELLRATEHMRLNASAIVARSTCNPFEADALRHHLGCVADEIEREAKRLQAIECKECRGVGARPAMSAGWCECIACRGAGTQKSKRSWPEGWPPFAVLRRAYSATGMYHYPSTRVCERSRVRSHRTVAAETRARWQRVLLQVLSDPSSP